ncbi:glycosyltransferase family 2 protein [Micromonospora craniellae]|uniref:Glycosyltransferase family 2 protein n=1 Tax=Micromonospora craniellae TaxID=2294034 RepID=A0A372G667_9ACTN|nr:glycosyltransferase family 2 protein [Micromonospora craniellae]QOC90134.1 glycosyltransferase [Micromonospora craniellae]RFS48478.1 glycosyltransferase family 2 protein [Micromonospora craniellae]
MTTPVRLLDGSGPDLVTDFELTAPVDIADRTSDGVRRTRAWIVLRDHGLPVGMLTLAIPDGGLPAAAVTEAFTGVRVPDPAALQAARERACRDGATVTAVVCTRERPEALRRCLESLLRQDYPHATILVVDNAPTSEATCRVVADFPSVRYVVEPRPGLSRARNRALAEIDTELVAWIDDDEVADVRWLTEIARAFLEYPDAAGMSGVVVPAEIETAAQAWYEAFGGHSKGRGFTAADFVPGAMRQSPLYPLPPFGVGANMAFRHTDLVAVGGFDEALGAGTLAEGGEDTLIFTRLLLADRPLLYRPAALTRHYHRRETERLAAQMRGYGVALTAFYTSLLLDRPLLLPRLLRLAPTALRDVSSGGSLRNIGLREGMPSEFMSLNKRGMAIGPWRYLRSRRQVRRDS